MPSLFVVDEDIASSPPVVGYKILSLLERKDNDQISIFEVVERLKKEQWFSTRKLYLGMIFLFAAGLIEFNQPYIVKNV